MKKIILCLAVLNVAYLYAYECPLNPDRFPSVGLNYVGSYLTGQSEFPNYNVEKQDVSTRNATISLDLTLPLNNSLSFNVGLSGNSQLLVSQETMNFAGQRVKQNGSGLKFGVRYYFNK